MQGALDFLFRGLRAIEARSAGTRKTVSFIVTVSFYKTHDDTVFKSDVIRPVLMQKPDIKENNP